jgi:hypothetical protein
MKNELYPNPASFTQRMLREKELEEQRKRIGNNGVTLASLMGLAYFRDVVSRWLAACGLDDPIKGTHSNDMQQALGRREIGLMIKKELEEADLDLYNLMVKEHRNRPQEKKNV